MTTYERADGDPEDLGGDCSPFVMVCSCIRSYTDHRGIKGPERHALIELVLAADFKTGIASSLSWEGVADLLSCSVPTAKQRLGALEAAGAIRYRFPRGHRGFVALLCYLDVVRVKPARAGAIAAALAEAEAEAEAKADAAVQRAAARAAATTKSSNVAAAEPTAPGTERIVRSEGKELSERDPLRLTKELAERPGNMADLRTPGSAIHSSSSSEGDVGGRGRGTTVAEARVASRSSRELEYDDRLLGEGA